LNHSHVNEPVLYNEASVSQC